jgi:hypothetical protein
MSGEEGFNVSVEKLGAIICLERVNGGAKLCARVCKEIYESARHTRLGTKWERPIIVREVIDNNKVISKTRITYNWRGPQITMYQIKLGTRHRGRQTKW